jgi:hypothetical protein
MARIEILRFVMLPVAFVAFMVAAQMSAGFHFRTSTGMIVASLR